jgi:hypothetical protein
MTQQGWKKCEGTSAEGIEVMITVLESHKQKGERKKGIGEDEKRTDELM